MKTKIKKIMIVALTIFLAISLITTVNAENANAGKVKSLFKGAAASSINGTTAVQNIISAVLGIVRTAGTAIAIIILMTIAAKYLMASAGDRADIKKYAVNYVIGAIILFGASGILTLVKQFVDASVK